MSTTERPWIRAWLIAALSTLLFVLGCTGEAEPLLVDPGVIRFAPERTRVEVTIHNRTPLARTLADFRLAGDDWDALKIVDAELPDQVAGGGSITLQLAARKRAFALDEGSYRAGRAQLEFESEGRTITTPIEFVAPSSARRFGASSLVIVLALALSGLMVAGALRRPTSPRPARREWTPARIGAALAFVGLIGALASIPLGPGLCSDRLAASVADHELAQCRAGLGGAPLLGLAAEPAGLWWWLLLACASVGVGLIALERDPERASARVGVLALRLLGAALSLACVTISLGASSPSELVLAQADSFELAGLVLPRWGLFAQPLAFVLAVSLIADAEPSPTLDPLARLDTLVWAAWIATVFLGGAWLPTFGAVHPLPHGLEVAMALALLLAKIAVVSWLLNARGAGTRSDHRLRARARWHAHVGLPLILLDLAATWVWHWLA